MNTRTFLILLLLGFSFSTSTRTLPILSAQVPTAKKLLDAPMTISASNVGNFAEGNSWYLSVNSAGQAVLTIQTLLPLKPRTFAIPEEQLNKLRKLLVEEDFFSLKSQYGSVVPDGSSSSITITIGQYTKSLRLDYYAKDTNFDELSRLFRVMVEIRTWFKDEEAFNKSPYLLRFLEIHEQDILIIDKKRAVTKSAEKESAEKESAEKKGNKNRVPGAKK